VLISGSKNRTADRRSSTLINSHKRSWKEPLTKPCHQRSSVLISGSKNRTADRRSSTLINSQKGSWKKPRTEPCHQRSSVFISGSKKTQPLIDAHRR